MYVPTAHVTIIVVFDPETSKVLETRMVGEFIKWYGAAKSPVIMLVLLAVTE